MRLEYNVLKHGYKMFRSSVPSLIVSLVDNRLIYAGTNEPIVLDVEHWFANDWVIVEQLDIRVEPDERIMCAAVIYETFDRDYTFMGVRHGCPLMQEQIAQTDLVLDQVKNVTDGFMTSKGRFVGREDAWNIALYAGQIEHRCGGDTLNGGHLFSENLW